MSQITKSIAIKAPIERVFDIVSNFAHYPEFLPEIVKADVISKSATKATVAFTALMIKHVDYTMDFRLKRPTDIRWVMIEGDPLIKSNTGFWKFEKLGKNLTDLTFSCDMSLSMWLPRSIADGVISNHAPIMMKNFKMRAEEGATRGHDRPPKRRAAKTVRKKKR